MNIKHKTATKKERLLHVRRTSSSTSNGQSNCEGRAGWLVNPSPTRQPSPAACCLWDLTVPTQASLWETTGVFVLGIGAGQHNSQGAWPGDARGSGFFLISKLMTERRNKYKRDQTDAGKREKVIAQEQTGYVNLQSPQDNALTGSGTTERAANSHFLTQSFALADTLLETLGPQSMWLWQPPF